MKCNLHFVKQVKKITPGLFWILIGCKAFSGGGSLTGFETSLSIARLHRDAGENYQAKKLTQAILDETPDDVAAQQLMGEIISRDIALHREMFEEVKAPEEFSSPEINQQIKTWVERSESLLALGQYDKALQAAEKVFLYDSDNLQASFLTDRIRKEAMKQGKLGYGLQQTLARDELSARVDKYRKTVRELIEEKRWGAAQHTVHKILLLSPEDPEGLRFQQTILSYRSQTIS